MNAYVFLAEGFEEVEAVTVIDVLRRGGITVTAVSISGSREVKGAHGVTLVADELFEYVTPYADILVLPGGMPGTKHLGEHKKLSAMLKQHALDGKLTAAICAAPSVLGQLGILEGRKATCYPGFEPQLEGAEVVHHPVVVDDHIVTSRGVGTALEFALKLIELTGGHEKAQNLREGMIVQHN